MGCATNFMKRRILHAQKLFPVSTRFVCCDRYNRCLFCRKAIQIPSGAVENFCTNQRTLTQNMNTYTSPSSKEAPGIYHLGTGTCQLHRKPFTNTNTHGTERWVCEYCHFRDSFLLSVPKHRQHNTPAENTRDDGNI